MNFSSAYEFNSCMYHRCFCGFHADDGALSDPFNSTKAVKAIIKKYSRVSASIFEN